MERVMSEPDIVSCVIVSATVLLPFAASFPEDAIKPWMRVALVLIGITSFLWAPWVCKLGQMNYKAAIGEPAVKLEQEK